MPKFVAGSYPTVEAVEATINLHSRVNYNEECEKH